MLTGKGVEPYYIYINDGSTGNAINHLLNDHEITNEGKINMVSYYCSLPFIKYYLCL